MSQYVTDTFSFGVSRAPSDSGSAASEEGDFEAGGLGVLCCGSAHLDFLDFAFRVNSEQVFSVEFKILGNLP